MTAVCRHGFQPEYWDTIPGWDRGCPSCEYEERLNPLLRFVAQHPHALTWMNACGFVLSLIAIVMSLGVVERWW
jgi:hypothetical protein